MSDNFPMPNTVIDGSTVVASCYYRDLLESDQQYKVPGDDWPDVVYLVMLLNKQPPFYTVSCVAWVDDGYVVLNRHDVMNINFATQHYAESGGDV